MRLSTSCSGRGASSISKDWLVRMSRHPKSHQNRVQNRPRSRPQNEYGTYSALCQVYNPAPIIRTYVRLVKHHRAPIDVGGALAVETARFRDIYNRIRPHQSLGDRTLRDAYLGITGGASV